MNVRHCRFQSITDKKPQMNSVSAMGYQPLSRSPGVRKCGLLLGSLTVAFLSACTGVIGASADDDGGSAPRSVQLGSRSFSPIRGVDPELLDLIYSESNVDPSDVHLMIQRSSMPGADEWRRWKAQGIEVASYLGDYNWVLRVKAESKTPEDWRRFDSVVQANAVTFLRGTDKLSRLLRQGSLPDWARASTPGMVRMVVGYSQGTPQDVMTAHLGELGALVDDIATAELDPWTKAIHILPTVIETLASADEVQRVEPGPETPQPTMMQGRESTGAEALQVIDMSGVVPTFSGWSGRGVRMSNGEGLGGAWNHGDFWNHDDEGNETTPRWLGCNYGSLHGMMTAGIMLGNGWHSEDNGGPRFGYRGIAPEATYDCRDNDPDVANESFAQGIVGDYNIASATSDRMIRGDVPSHFHPAVGAAANNGLTAQYGVEVGYYSLLRNNKNEIIV